MYQDVVALLPGFLGFSHFGGFYYFADRVASALRTALEVQTGRPVPVIPFSTLPTTGLEGRQEFLLGSLGRLDAMMGGMERLHLVGHSAGGVDAFLLTQDRPFDGAPPDPRGIRNRIRSVTTIGSPHQGTGLAETDFAQFLGNPLAHMAGLPALGKAVVDALRAAPAERELPGAVTGTLLDWRESFTFLVQVLQKRELIQALRPERMAALYAKCRPDPQVPARLACFVTGTSAPAADNSQSDPLYRDLYTLTAKGSKELSVAALAAERILSSAGPDKIVKNPNARLPTFDETTNDGIVNSICQLAHPENADELAGIVVSDHGDCLGHYPRVDPLTGDGSPDPKKAIHAGLFHSGAGFRDDQFFDLYRRVSYFIRSTI
jgi:pimeloyl-ACP methyl ester carboxylesterase